jgi:hypothetical protein
VRKEPGLPSLECFVSRVMSAPLGGEITKIELGGVRKHFADGGTSVTPHVMFTLVGCFKLEQGERHHVILVAAVTGSGMEVRNGWSVSSLRKRNGALFQVSCLLNGTNPRRGRQIFK